MKSSKKSNELLFKRIERQNVMTLGLLKGGLSALSLDRGHELLERRTKFLLSTTLSLLTTLRRRCRTKKRITGTEARLFLLGLKWSVVGFMIAMGHRFCTKAAGTMNHGDIIDFVRRSLSMIKEIVCTVRFAIGIVSPLIIFEKSLSSSMFSFLCDMRINKVMQQLLLAGGEASRDDMLRTIHVVDTLEAMIEETHDQAVEVDDAVLAFMMNGIPSKRRESVRKKAVVSH
jgi:hypothetical protein